MGVTADFTAGLAQLLEDESVGAWRPDPGDSYLDAETGIVTGVMPARPDRAVAITPYLPVDDPTQAESAEMVQFKTRGTRDIRTSQDIQDAIFDVLQNLPRRQVGGVIVAGCWRRSGGYLGVDENGRHQHSSNYEFRLSRPSTHRS